jgi:CO/xanthine dehydrogenase FAD-binding subunit
MEPQVFKPQQLGELLSVYAAHTDALLFAGGIECMKRIAAGERPAAIIDLSGIDELKRISRTERYIDIGAALPLSYILSIGRHVIPRVLYDALGSISAPSVKNTASLGGNICTASPYSDSLVALLALEARLELRSLSASRWLSVGRFIQEEESTDLRPGEVLTRIRIPLGPWSVQVFRSVAASGLPTVSSVTFCGLARILKGVVQDIRFSIGSVNSKIVRDRSMETPLIGHKIPIGERDIQIVTSRLRELLDPIESPYTTELYRIETAGRMLTWFLREIGGLLLQG